MSLEVTTYLRLQADQRALEQQTRAAFIRAVIELNDQGLSGLAIAKRLGVSQPHVSRTLFALRASGQVGGGRSEPAGPFDMPQAAVTAGA